MKTRELGEYRSLQPRHVLSKYTEEFNIKMQDASGMETMLAVREVEKRGGYDGTISLQVLPGRGQLNVLKL